MDWFGKERLANTQFKNMTINGEPVAAIQNVDNFSFALVLSRCISYIFETNL